MCRAINPTSTLLHPVFDQTFGEDASTADEHAVIRMREKEGKDIEECKDGHGQKRALLSFFHAHLSPITATLDQRMSIINISASMPIKGIFKNIREPSVGRMGEGRKTGATESS